MNYPQLTTAHLELALQQLARETSESLPTVAQRHQLEAFWERPVEHRAVRLQLSELLGCIAPPAMVFDGAALDAHLYPQPGLRPVPEIHLFVPPDQLAASLSALRGLGYQSQLQKAHWIRLRSSKFAADLLLHWSLGWDIPWGPVLEAARPLPFGDAVALVPQVDDLLLLRMLDLRRQGWRVPLLHFWDLAVCLSHGAAAEESNFRSRAQAWGLLPIFPLLGDALELFGLPHPFAGALAGELRQEARERVVHFSPPRTSDSLGRTRRFDRWLAHGQTWPWRFWGLLLQAWVLLWLVELGLRGPGYVRMKRWFELESERAPAQGKRAPVVEAVLSAGRIHPCRPQCLARAIALCLMLRRRGLGGQVRLGARQRGPRFQAHAWLEIDRQRLDVGESFWDFHPFGNDLR